MIVKEIISEEILTLAEVKEILNGLREKETKTEGEEEGVEEIRYEKRKALGHATKFAKIDAKKSKLLIKELLGLEKMNDEIAVRIADIMPKSKSEVRAIYAKERFSLTEEDIENILECVAKYE